MSIKGHHSVKILPKMTGNNPKLDIVNVDVHTKFGLILSIRSQDIEWKRNSDVSQGQAAQCSLVQNIYFGLQKIGILCPKNRRKIGNYRP